MADVTHIGDDAANDDLALASGLHGCVEVGVVHSIDFTVPVDNGDIGVHFCDLREERAVGA